MEKSWRLFGDILVLESFWRHFGDILDTFWYLDGFWRHFGEFLDTFWKFASTPFFSAICGGILKPFELLIATKVRFVMVYDKA